MTEPMQGGRRRIDLVLAEDFLADIDSVDLDDVRYPPAGGRAGGCRPLLHPADAAGPDGHPAGRAVPPLGARRRHREDRRPPSRILSDDAGRADHGLGRFLTVEPSRVDEHRRKVEQVIADVGVSEVEGHSDDEVRAALRRLEELEREVSETRQRVQKVMDALTTEITRRYRTGAANVDDLLAER